MLIVDLLRRQQQGSFAWAPMGTGVGLPNVMNAGAEAAAAGARGPSAWSPGLPRGCEDDYECNDGRANFPLQCCELPLLGNFCCEPGELAPPPQSPAYVPLPVPVEK